jgi:agmatine/peptidylarginine deiminase
MKDIIKEVAEVAQVYVFVADQKEETDATALLSGHGVDMSQVEFHLYDGSSELSFWMRDFGPIFFLENGVRKILDFKHSYHCDDMPWVVGHHTNIPVIDANEIELPGGNFISDGRNSSVMSQALYDEDIPEGNDYVYNLLHFPSQESILQAISGYTGNEKNILTPYLANEKTHHLDLWAKQLTLKTFIVGEYTSGTNAALLDQVASQLEAEGYTVVRIPQPDQEPQAVTREILEHHISSDYLKRTATRELLVTYSYTNSLLVNGKVLMPAYGFPTDEEARAVYEQVLLDYEVVLIDCSQVIEWGGAIHCTTMQMPQEDSADE